jgi:hypothetical protein
MLLSRMSKGVCWVLRRAGTGLARSLEIWLWEGKSGIGKGGMSSGLGNFDDFDDLRDE